MKTKAMITALTSFVVYERMGWDPGLLLYMILATAIGAAFLWQCMEDWKNEQKKGR